MDLDASRVALDQQLGAAEEAIIHRELAAILERHPAAATLGEDTRMFDCDPCHLAHVDILVRDPITVGLDA